MKTNHLRGTLIVLISGVCLAVLMFLPRFSKFGFALGFALLLLIIAGVLDFFGALKIASASVSSLSNPQFDVSKETGLIGIMLKHFNVRIFYVGMALMVAGACRISVVGTMGAAAAWSGPLLIVLGIGAVLLAKTRRGEPNGNLHHRFFVMSIAVAALMSTLGSQGLWDCWETHYAEVARRQLEQDDWISLFWQDSWFYSKPILLFWIMNLGMVLFGVNVLPDKISPHAEWGVRFFIAVIALAVIFSVYELISRRISKRAGVITALVLGTMPIFGFMARQAITDMPFIGFMTMAVVFFLLGITAPKDAQVKAFQIPVGRGKKIELSGFHAVIASYIALAVPQFLYIATRNDKFIFGTFGRDDLRITTSSMRFTGWHLSDFFDISSLLERIVRAKRFVKPDISLDWFIMGMAFLALFSVILLTLRKERRVFRLCFHAMYMCLALSVMAKGIGGIGIPAVGLVAFWLIEAPWKKLMKIDTFILWHFEKVRHLDLLRGISMFLIVALPWHIAMKIRHGQAFITEYLGHDHFDRLSSGVHGDRGTFQYFVEQFGYAAFPWVAFLPFALLAWQGLINTSRPETSQERQKRIIRSFAICWFITSFALLSFMMTKFHHYVFPLIPPCAIIIGLFIDDIWSRRIARLGPVVVAAAAIAIVIAIDLSSEPNAAEGVTQGYAKLIGLFIYKYSRPYPEGAAYDFSLPVAIFSALFVFSVLGWLSRRRFYIAAIATFLVVLGFNHFVMQHYMVKLAPHWTQRHIVDEYYKKRNSPKERFVAFQMNWKGENFYTGNRVVVYVSTTNREFEKWVEEHRGERHFFITEHNRFKTMSSRAAAKSGPLIPLADTCNKYRAGFADKL